MWDEKLSTRAVSCSIHRWYVGASLGWVWFRGSRQTFVAVKPDGSVLDAGCRTREAAIVALAMEARRREGLGAVVELGAFRPREELSSVPPPSFGRGILSLLGGGGASN